MPSDCSKLEEELYNLESSFIKDYITKYVDCGFIDILKKETLTNSDQEENTFDTATKAMQNLHAYTIKNKNFVGFPQLPLSLASFSKFTDLQIQQEEINTWNAEFKDYVKNFVKEAFDSTSSGSGTNFIAEYEKVENEFKNMEAQFLKAVAEYKKNPDKSEEELTGTESGNVDYDRNAAAAANKEAVIFQKKGQYDKSLDTKSQGGGGDEIGFQPAYKERGYLGYWTGWNRRGAPERNGYFKVALYKYAMWTIILLLLFYVIGGSPSTVRYVLAGFNSIVSGECSNAAHFILGRFGIAHPLCTVYKDTIRTLFNAFFMQSPQAMMTLCINLAQVIIYPTFASVTINIFICAVGELVPVFDDNEKSILNSSMKNSMAKMSHTRNAVIDTLSNLVSIFSNVVTNTRLEGLKPEDTEIKPSRTARALRMKGNTIRQKAIAQAAAAEQRAAAERAAAEAAPAPGPLRQAALSVPPSPGITNIHDSLGERPFGGKKSRRRRRRGRKSRKH